MPSVIEKPVAQSSGDRYREAADLIASYGHAMDDGEIDLWPQFSLSFYSFAYFVGRILPVRPIRIRYRSRNCSRSERRECF